MGNTKRRNTLLYFPKVCFTISFRADSSSSPIWSGTAWGLRCSLDRTRAERLSVTALITQRTLRGKILGSQSMWSVASASANYRKEQRKKMASGLIIEQFVPTYFTWVSPYKKLELIRRWVWRSRYCDRPFSRTLILYFLVKSLLFSISNLEKYLFWCTHLPK